jgi:glycosyltransferase involved in cell wall biosynthesis
VIDVMHVISGLGTGGAETMLVQLAAALRARGVSQHVVGLGPQTELADDLRAAGVDLTVIGARSAWSLPSARRLLRAVNEWRPRIVQGWMYHGNLAASLGHNLCQGRRSRRLFWNLRASNMDVRRYGRIIRLSALLSPQVDVVIANSEAGMEFHRGRGFAPRRLATIANGIDTERFRPDPQARHEVRAALGIADDAVVVLHVARVDPMKDHGSFLAAMAQVPSLVGLMAGEGTQQLSGPANVWGLGLRRDILRLYAAADIVASTSAFGEGFSNAVAEGMSAGLVAVATDVGDIRRIVGETGWIVPPGDPGRFAVALGEAAALPESELRRRGMAARERVEANFTLAQAADSFARLYAAP